MAFSEYRERDRISGHSPFFLEMIQAADRGNDTLLDLAFDSVVFDDLQVLVVAGFLYSGEHGVSFN